MNITVDSKEWETFKKKAKWLTKRNRFSFEEWTLMEAWALADIIGAKLRFDAKKGASREKYVNTVIGNALARAAQRIADERSVWTRSRASLDSPAGDAEGAMTLCDLVQAQAGVNANAKLGTEPMQVRIRNRINRLKREKDSAALERLRRRLQCADASPDGGEDEEPRTKPDYIEPVTAEEEEAADLGNVGASDAEDLNRLAYGLEQQHGDAIEEVGLADDPDEGVESPVHENRMTGYGDCAEAVYLQTLHYDVATLMNEMEPRMKRFCLYVLGGCTMAEAREACRFSRRTFYTEILPALRTAFASLRYAL